jgi:2-hydroxychromene-2-carboxylate isomerase
MGDMPRIDFWYEFGSSYSYPAAMRIEAAAAGAGVAVRWRPFLLGPIFKAQGWSDSPFNLLPIKGRYMWRDLERICADLGLPFRQPVPFPQRSVTAARIALVGLDEGWGVAFSKALYRAEFGDGQDINARATLTAILQDLRQAPEPVFSRVEAEETKTRLRAATDEAQRLGVFGAPTFVTADGELFWGNDRLEQALEWAAERKRGPI